jgi:peptidoglycan hydrolase-like protein with peptidoglycan-binding domain
VGASVQRALVRQGYYRGGIDGQIGPYPQRCIARYQADRGLRPTGMISQDLLRSLGLE